MDEALGASKSERTPAASVSHIRSTSDSFAGWTEMPSYVAVSTASLFWARSACIR
jgi:hypothetical protein